MTEPRRGLRWRLGVAGSALLLWVAGAPLPAADRELLAASDLFAAAPAEFRALVRFLEPEERGKFLLRRDGQQYFLAPGSARPVRLGPNHRMQGAFLHELLGLDLARDYEIASESRESGVATFDLEARGKEAAAPRLRWVVNVATRRPLRADLQSSSGKVLRVLEFKEWRDPARGVPGRLVIKDLVAGGGPIEVTFESFAAGAVDDALFDLEDGGARAALLSAAPAPPPVPR